MQNRLQRQAAFADGERGGNPACIYLADELPPVDEMQSTATAAFAGYLSDLGWPHGGSIEVIQGEDMGSSSRLRAEISDRPGSSIRVCGRVRPIEE